MIRAIQLAVACVAVLVATVGQLEAGLLIVGGDDAADITDVRNKINGTGLVSGPVDTFDFFQGRQLLGSCSPMTRCCFGTIMVVILIPLATFLRIMLTPAVVLCLEFLQMQVVDLEVVGQAAATIRSSLLVKTSVGR